MKFYAVVFGLLSMASSALAAQETVLDCDLYTDPMYSEFRIGAFTQLVVSRDSAGTISARAIAPAYANKTVALGDGEISALPSGQVQLSFDAGNTLFTLGYNSENYRYEGEGRLEREFASSVSCVVYSEF